MAETRVGKMLDDDLAELPLAEQAELQALRRLSTDALQTIAAEQMATATKERMAQLIEENSRGTLFAAEYHELTMLVEHGDQLMLRKAEALRLLHERGYPVSTKDSIPSYV